MLNNCFATVWLCILTSSSLVGVWGSPGRSQLGCLRCHGSVLSVHCVRLCVLFPPTFVVVVSLGFRLCVFNVFDVAVGDCLPEFSRNCFGFRHVVGDSQPRVYLELELVPGCSLRSRCLDLLLALRLALFLRLGFPIIFGQQC